MICQGAGDQSHTVKRSFTNFKNEGLIVHSATRRSSVADPSLEEVSENLIVLGAFEALAGELACKHASGAEITQILAVSYTHLTLPTRNCV